MGPRTPHPPGQSQDPQAIGPDPPPHGCSSERPRSQLPHQGPSPHCPAAGRPNHHRFAVTAKGASRASTASPSFTWITVLWQCCFPVSSFGARRCATELLRQGSLLATAAPPPTGP
ncbi:hypothetical protein NDU88_003161 [Pleurodeles waltl]|uniref:Uncharacterized protein n=1 Tax=Pleurodeles waltl TaxID=8319 RepID=A0AAV7L5B7_PLEWA|nr:hypothetical protein NDU88_003161 [Pleurodeles waltl]